MQRLIVNNVGVRKLYHLSEIHYGYTVAYMANYEDIVGNEEIGETQLLLKLNKHIDYLCLNRNVKSGNRLVADNERGAEGKGAGDADALALTAGKFMGIAGGVLAVQANFIHKLEYAFASLGLIIIHLMYVKRLRNNIGDSHSGIQRGVGVLEYHIRFFTKLHDIAFCFNKLSVKLNLAARRLVQVQKGAAYSRFSAA